MQAQGSPPSRTRGGARGGVARARAEKQRRKRKLGGASAPKEGAPAASVRSGVAMGRGSGTFERLLGNASARQLQVSLLAHRPDAASVGLRRAGRPPRPAVGLRGARHGSRASGVAALAVQSPGVPVRNALWESATDLSSSGFDGPEPIGPKS